MKRKIDYQEFVKINTRNFYYPTLLFPKKIRKNVFLLYSFVRIIDDFVDKRNPNKKKFYIYKKQLLDFLKNNKEPKIKIVKDFGDLVKEKNLKKEIIDYLKTQEKEIKLKKYITLKDFNSFLYGTAGTIGIMMAKILNFPKKTYKDAKKLGESLQIINIIRDVMEDYKMKKIYIPEELLKKYKLNHKNFLLKKNLKKLNKVIILLIKKSFILKNSAEKSYHYLEKDLIFPIKVAVDLYFQIANKIKRRPQLIFNKNKLKPNLFEIIKIIIKNYIFTKFLIFKNEN